MRLTSKRGGGESKRNAQSSIWKLRRGLHPSKGTIFKKRDLGFKQKEYLI